MQKGAAHILAILIAVIALAGVGFVGYSVLSNQASQAPTETAQEESFDSSAQDSASDSSEKLSDKFIVANPVDLTHIESISKFRSCYGHDYSGLNVDEEEEPISSMKHYLRASLDVSPSTDQVAVRAPFDGKITRVSDSGSGPGDIQFRFAGDSSQGWQMVFFHIAENPNIEMGAEFSAGETIGYANLNTNTGPYPTFDISLEKMKGASSAPGDVSGMSPSQMMQMREMMQEFQENPQEAQKKYMMFTSPFNYMTDDVLSEYSQRGITTENILFSKEEREANPCPTAATSRGPNVDFAQTTGNFIELN